MACSIWTEFTVMSFRGLIFLFLVTKAVLIDNLLPYFYSQVCILPVCFYPEVQVTICQACYSLFYLQGICSQTLHHFLRGY